jgi:hypothetical protein
MTTQATEAAGHAPDHEQKRAALGYLNEAWLEARIDGIDGDSGKAAPKKANPCPAIEADEELIANVLAAATSWHEQGGMLLVRSNPKDAWIELRR